MNYINDYMSETVTPAKSEKKKSKAGAAIAITVAVMLMGGGAGFALSRVYTDYTGSQPESARDLTPSVLPDNKKVSSQNGLPQTDTLPSARSDGAYNAVELFEKVGGTVVGIKLSDGKGYDSGVIGSGVIFSTDGYILTCDHVVAGSKKVIVVVDDYDDPTVQHEYDAEVVGTDEPTDVAVIKIERKEPFNAAPLGSSDSLKIGQDICAIGNPVELEKTITKGIVSGKNRDLGGDAYVLPSIQFDAAVNPGNSGCPLFDMYGNVVGIVNIKIVYGAEIDNLGFAISIDQAKPIIDELLENGSITSRPMLGISAREIGSGGMMWGDVENGLWVDSVKAGTPAEESGLARGDIITKIDGNDIYTVTDVHSAIKDKKAGDKVKVTIVRYDNYGEKSTLVLDIALTSSYGN